MGALGVGLLVAAAVWWFAAGRTARGAYPGRRVVTAVAVLPLRDPASSPDSSYLADGMTEGLIADLAQIGSLKFISGSSGSRLTRSGVKRLPIRSITLAGERRYRQSELRRYLNQQEMIGY
jgi:TolB-like protein